MLLLVGIRRAPRLCALALLSVAVGCSRGEPDPADRTYSDSNGRVPASVGGAKLNPAVAEGQAEWVAFREPPPPEPAGADRPESEPLEAPAAGAAGADGAGLREIIEDYNSLTADGSVDDLLDYFVPEQSDALRPVVEKALARAGKLIQFCEAGKAAAGESAADLPKVCQAARRLYGAGLNVEGTPSRAEQGFTFQVTSRVFPRECRAVLREEDWYFEVVDVAALAQSAPALDAFDGQLEQWRKDLESGSISSAEVLAAFRTAVQGEGGGEEDAPPPSEG